MFSLSVFGSSESEVWLSLQASNLNHTAPVSTGWKRCPDILNQKRLPVTGSVIDFWRHVARAKRRWNLATRKANLRGDVLKNLSTFTALGDWLCIGKQHHTEIFALRNKSNVWDKRIAGNQDQSTWLDTETIWELNLMIIDARPQVKGWDPGDRVWVRTEISSRNPTAQNLGSSRCLWQGWCVSTVVSALSQLSTDSHRDKGK